MCGDYLYGDWVIYWNPVSVVELDCVYVSGIVSGSCSSGVLCLVEVVRLVFLELNPVLSSCDVFVF